MVANFTSRVSNPPSGSNLTYLELVFVQLMLDGINTFLNTSIDRPTNPSPIAYVYNVLGSIQVQFVPVATIMVPFNLIFPLGYTVNHAYITMAR